MDKLDDRIDYLESKVPAAKRHVDDPRDRRVVRDRWWRRQTRWAEAARAMVILFVVWAGLQVLGYRIVDRQDAELAVMVVRLHPNAYHLAEADLRHRLEGRAAAITAFEGLLGSKRSSTGWISQLFTASPTPEAVRRAEIGEKLAERIAKLPSKDVGSIIDRLFALAHHFGETITFEAIEQFAQLPNEIRSSLFNNHGEALTRIARASGSYEQASSQLQATERVLLEESADLGARRAQLELERTKLSDQYRIVLGETARSVAARTTLNACIAAAQRQRR